MYNKIIYNRYSKIFTHNNRRSSMTVGSIFSHIDNKYVVNLLPETHPSISLVKDKPFYVSPLFKEYNNDAKARIVLFSAPGATGKSALAKHIAYEYSSLYWNLADIRLGETSFFGALVTALGSTQYSPYINALLASQTLLVVDAFDESEVNSGESMVRALINDMDNVLKDCSKPYAAFFSRTETAQNIGEFLKNNNIPYVHYEIGLFAEYQARSFIKDYIIAEKGKCTSVQEDVINQFFTKIERILVNPDDYNNFIGYAPVLQSIAITIMSNENTISLLNSLSNTRSVGIIHEIMKHLIDRETGKFKSAFEMSVDNSYRTVAKQVNAYSEMEQFARTLLYILDFDIRYDDYPLEGMPPQLIDAYENKINSFLPQHTFIMSTMENSKKNFVGPAFRDFVLANIFLDNNFSDFANDYISGNASESHFPSQLFWDFYMNKCENKVPLIHLPYLFESYKSRNKIHERSCLNITVYDGQGVASFETIDVTTGKRLDEQNVEIIGLDKVISFHKLTNVTIDGDVDVELRSAGPIVINDSSLDCRSLKIEANQLEINVSDQCVSYLISKENITSTRVPKTNLNINGTLHVSAPNIYVYHALAPYKVDNVALAQSGADSFSYNVRKIFSYFRQHKKIH